MLRQPLDGVIVKLWRAKKHLDELESDMIAKRGKEYGVFRHHDVETGDGLDYVFIPYNLRVVWGMSVGDVVHNTRAALDHLAYQLVVVNGGKPRRTSFPIYLNLADYRNNQGQVGVRGMSQYAIALIESLRPKSRDDPLWILKALDDMDKHNLIHVAALGARLGRVHFAMPDGSPVPMRAPLELGSDRALVTGIEDGADLFAYAVAPGVPEVAVVTSGTAEITFAESGPGKGHPVIPLLTQLIEYVETGIVPLFRLDQVPAKAPTWTPPG